MRCNRLVMAAIIVALFAASSAQAELITNGDFESVSSTDGRFTGWSYNNSTKTVTFVESTNPIGGTGNSAEMITGATNGYQIFQSVSFSTASTYEYSVDFAVFPVTTNNTRTFHAGLQGLEYAGSGTVLAGISMRVSTTDNGLSQVFQVYNQFQGTAGWQTIATVEATDDEGTAGVWDGETPTVNELTIVLNWGEATPNYDLTLNDVTYEGLSYFQFGTPSNTSTTLSVMCIGSQSSSNYLVDNVSLNTVPEPSTLALLASGLIGLPAYAWRKRR